MLEAGAVVLGCALVIAAFVDLINTLVTTSTVKGRWWLSRIISRSYWLLRRIISLFEELTHDADLSAYAEHMRIPDESDDVQVFDDLYDRLESHGFVLLPKDVALRRAAAFRNRFAPPMEYMIDALMCPRGFWSPALNIDMHGTEFLDGVTGDRSTN